MWLATPRNPYDRERITGGSSSGSAIAVSTGAVPAALGSDTAGSLRLPAAACGIKSLKPTWTRVSRAGCMPLSGGLDCVGPIARHAEDLAALMSLIAGTTHATARLPGGPCPTTARRLRKSPKASRSRLTMVSSARPIRKSQAKLRTALGVLESEGCIPQSASCSNWREIDHLTQLLQLPEVASAHGHLLRTRADDYGPQVRARIEFGHFISGADHQTALRARGLILDTFLREVMGDCDAMILPVFADPVPTIAELDLEGGPTLMAALARVIFYTRPVNYLALPAVTLPYARKSSEVPNGFQLIGRPFSEAKLLTLAAAYERAVHRKLRRCDFRAAGDHGLVKIVVSTCTSW